MAEWYVAQFVRQDGAEHVGRKAAKHSLRYADRERGHRPASPSSVAALIAGSGMITSPTGQWRMAACIAGSSSSNSGLAACSSTRISAAVGNRAG